MNSSIMDNLVFVGFHSQVIALDRDTGHVAWNWKAEKGSGFVAILMDGDRLIVSVGGYTYALDPNSGTQLWFNPLKGFGTGIPCLASIRGSTLTSSAAAQDEEDSQAAAAASTPAS